MAGPEPAEHPVHAGKGGKGLSKGPHSYYNDPQELAPDAPPPPPKTIWSNVSNATEWAMVFDREMRRSGAIVNSETGHPILIPEVLSLVLEYVSPGFHEVMSQCPKWVLTRSLNAIPKKIHRFGFKWRYLSPDGTVDQSSFPASAAPAVSDGSIPETVKQLRGTSLAVRTTAEFAKELHGELLTRREWCFHARRRVRSLHEGAGFTPPSFTRAYLPESPFGDPTEGDSGSDDERTAARARIPRNRERDVVTALCELIDSEAPGVVRVATSAETVLVGDDRRTKIFRVWIGPDLEIPTGAALAAMVVAATAAAEAAAAAATKAKAAAAAADAVAMGLIPFAPAPASRDEKPPALPPVALVLLPPATSDGRPHRPVLELEFTRSKHHRNWWGHEHFLQSDDYGEVTSFPYGETFLP